MDGFRALPDAWSAATVLGFLGLAAAARHDLQRAAALHAESLTLFRSVGSRDGVAGCLASVAALAAAAGKPEPAARLYGASAALAEEVGALPNFPERTAHERGLESARAALGPAAFAAAYAAGRAQPSAQAIEEALTFATALASTPAARTTVAERNPAGLSAREVEVVRLVAEGLTNPQVAERLFLSPRTVDAHLQRIYNKLDVSTRGATIRFAVDHGLA